MSELDPTQTAYTPDQQEQSQTSWGLAEDINAGIITSEEAAEIQTQWDKFA